MQNNLSELDAMLHDLSSSKYTSRSAMASASMMEGDYSSDYGGTLASNAPRRPPPPKSYTQAGEKRSKKQGRRISTNYTLSTICPVSTLSSA